MKNLFTLVALSILTINAFSQTYSGPESVEFDPTGNRWFISNTSSGQILARNGAGTLSVFATGVSPSPYGLEMCWGNLYAACGGTVKGWDMSGNQIFNVDVGGQFLNGITHDNNGNIYVTDFNGYKIYKVNVTTGNFSTFVTGLTAKPNGIIWDQAQNRLVFVSWGSNVAIRAVNLADSTVSTLTSTTMSSCDGIAQDGAGNFYISNWGAQTIRKYTNDFSSSSVVVSSGISNPADIYYNLLNDSLASPNAGNNTVTFYYFGQPALLTVCNDIPLTLLTDSTTWGASDGMTSGTDSMLYCRVKNTSNYSYAYPQVKLNPLDPFPAGMSLHAGSDAYVVIASSWNPGVTVDAKFYFDVNTPITADATLRFTMSATNLTPANTDTCLFTDTLVVQLKAVGTGIQNLETQNIQVYPNPVINNLFINAESTPSQIIVRNMLGEAVLTKKMTQSLDLTQFPSGIYILELEVNGVRKFVKVLKK